MKYLMLSLLVLSSGPTAAADSLNDRMDEVLNDNLIEIQMLGTLTFCDRSGLRDPIYQKISDSIVGRSETNAVELLRIADKQSAGVAMGIKIGSPSPERKRELCDFAVRYVDQILDKRMKGSGS